MRDLLARLLGTAQIVFFALLPPVDTGPAGGKGGVPASPGPAAGETPERPAAARPGAVAAGHAGPAGALRCTPRQIRGGMGRLLDSGGELRILFPRCLAIAAPVLLFRLKREGFSGCSVRVWDRGLLVRGRR